MELRLVFHIVPAARVGVCLAAAVILAAPRASGITTRHDVPDASYVSLAGLYPSVGQFSVGTAGTLIDPHWILTAAHVAATLSIGSSTFSVGGNFYGVQDIVVHPSYVSIAMGHDIALIQLQAPVLNVTPAAWYTGNFELGLVGTSVGFGHTGTGLTGATGPDGAKRAMQNDIDAFGDGTLLLPNTAFLSDFDNPGNLLDSTLGFPTAAGLEGLVALGDSGGGVFIDEGSGPVLAGVHSFVLALRDGNINSSYSDLMGSTRVSLYDEFIRSTIQPVPEPGTAAILGLGALGLLLVGRRRANANQTPGRASGC